MQLLAGKWQVTCSARNTWLGWSSTLASAAAVSASGGAHVASADGCPACNVVMRLSRELAATES